MPGDASVPVLAPVAKAPSFFSTILDRLFWVGLVLGGIYFWNYLQGDQGGPKPVVDASFVKIGKEFKTYLTGAYSAAWSEAADELEGGKSMDEAAVIFEKSWSNGRTQAFGDHITPELAKIVPESQKTLTAAERSGMVRAWRGLAKGLK